MESKTTAVQTPEKPADSAPKEKILFEVQPLVLPTILNLENLTLIGFSFVILLAAVAFRFGPWEFIIVGILYLLLAFPSFYNIFRAGSTTYVLTNRRLVIFTVNVRRKERSIPLDQIQEARCKPSGLQRFYGAGDLIIYLKALRKPIRMTGIKGCRDYSEQIMKAARKAQGK